MDGMKNGEGVVSAEVKVSTIEIIEPLTLVAEATLYCPCGAKYNPPEHGDEPNRVTILIGDEDPYECHCGRTFRLICRVEAEL
jgi:hypothetical protein